MPRRLSTGYFEPYVEFRTRVSRIPLKTPSGEEVCIEICPGTSFGAEHKTTRLCVRALEAIFKNKRVKNVLDFGCGSGILGISAAVLGAQSILAVDIDPVAAREAVKNAERNGVSSKIRILQGSLEGVKGKFDLVIANIVTDELLRMLGGIKSVLERGGMLLVSGISELKKEGAMLGFKGAGFSLNREFVEGGWVAIWFKLGSDDGL